MFTPPFRALAVAAIAGFLSLAPASAAPVPAAPTEAELKARALKLNDLTELPKMDEELKAILKDKAAAKRLVQVALDLHKEAKGKEKPFKFGAALILGKVAHNTKQYEAAEAFYKFCDETAAKVENPTRMAQAFEALIDLYWDQKKFDAVTEVVERLLATDGGKELEPAKMYGVEKMIQGKARGGDADAALKLIDQVYKKGWYSLQLKAFVYRESGDLDKALEAYAKVVEALDDADGLEKEIKERYKKNTRYVMTGVHVDNKEVDKAADILKALLKEEPDSATFHNDLGFIWADHDKNLEESEKLIRKALDLDKALREKLLKEKKIDEETAKKQNAAYVDSLAWVLYKQKKYAEAKKYMLEAVKDDDESQSLEIWDHLADIHMALDEKKEAIAVWQKALRLEDTSKRDLDRRKKITEKLTKAGGKPKKED